MRTICIGKPVRYYTFPTQFKCVLYQLNTEAVLVPQPSIISPVMPTDERWTEWSQKLTDQWEICNIISCQLPAATCSIRYRCEHARCAASVDNQVNIRECPLMRTLSCSWAGNAAYEQYSNSSSSTSISISAKTRTKPIKLLNGTQA